MPTSVVQKSVELLVVKRPEIAPPRAATKPDVAAKDPGGTFEAALGEARAKPRQTKSEDAVNAANQKPLEAEKPASIDDPADAKPDPAHKPKPNAKSGAKAAKSEDGEILVDAAQGTEVNACADDSADASVPEPADATDTDQGVQPDTASKPNAEEIKVQPNGELAAELTVPTATPTKPPEQDAPPPTDASDEAADESIPKTVKLDAVPLTTRKVVGTKTEDDLASIDVATDEDTDASEGATGESLRPDAPVRTTARHSETQPAHSPVEAGVTSLPAAAEPGAPTAPSKKTTPIDAAQNKEAHTAVPPPQPEGQPSTPTTAAQSSAAPLNAPAVVTAPTSPVTHAPTTHAAAPTLAQSAPPEVDFVAANHAKIVTGIRGDLLPGGGSMQIRLDPPELGALQISVRMQDGVMTASFQTSSDDATKLLSHSLSQLKSVLESQGVSVEKLHVEQAPRDQRSDNDPKQNQQHPNAAYDRTSARQEQQRKEMLRRMWRRLSFGSDPLDMVA